MSGPGAASPLDVHPPQVAVREAVALALAEDVLPLGDLSAAVVPAGAPARFALVARGPGVVAGQRCAEEAFALVDPGLSVAWHRPDGSAVGSGDVVAEVEGRLRSIVTAERTALNFCCHLSGVATLTRRFVDAVAAVDPTVRILDTRKTTPGLRALEKAAVRAGGGRNHRASLSDAVMVKDNHLAGVGIAEAVARARDLWPGRMVEVECDRPEQVEEACRARATAVLLDNMSPSEAADCTALARRLAAGAGVLVEVSGGVTLDTVAAYAAAGVDVISVGALTHSVPVLDMGLDLVAADAGHWPEGEG
ncbi:MAG: carboxylating nicotinate-nucleotide diphosphorylase [Acidimicrobiales bacterium]